MQRIPFFCLPLPCKTNAAGLENLEWPWNIVVFLKKTNVFKSYFKNTDGDVDTCYNVDEA